MKPLTSRTATATATAAPVPMSGPDIGPLEIASVTEVLHSGCLSIGPRLGQPSSGRWRSCTGARHAVGVSSGTAGLHLAAIAAGVESGDMVDHDAVLVRRVGQLHRCTSAAIPVFVDVDPVTGNIDPVLVAEAVRAINAEGARGARTVAAAVTARFRFEPRRASKPSCRCTRSGSRPTWIRSSRWRRRMAWQSSRTPARRSAPNTRAARSARWATCGVFAFYPNKQATTGEGGMHRHEPTSTGPPCSARCATRAATR